MCIFSSSIFVFITHRLLSTFFFFKGILTVCPELARNILDKPVLGAGNVNILFDGMPVHDMFL